MVAELILLLTCMVWGLSFPLMRMCIMATGPTVFLFFKYAFATLVFLPFSGIFHRRHAVTRHLFRGMCLGVLYFTACFFQALALENIHAGRCAFITALNLVFVPILNPIFHRKIPALRDLVTIAFVLLGMYLLLDPSGGKGIEPGDWLAFIGAFFFALHLQTLQKFTREFHEPMVFAFYQTFFITLFSLFPFLYPDPVQFAEIVRNIKPFIWLLLVFLGGVVICGSFYIQARYQPRVSPARAALIYNLQPFFAALTAYSLLSEKMSPQAITGAALATTAVIIAGLIPARKPPQESVKSLSSLPEEDCKEG